MVLRLGFEFETSCVFCGSVAIRVLGKRVHGSGADQVPEDRWQEMAVL